MPRLRECHRLLSPTGVFCLHLDYRSVHYAKIELDKIFGEKNFINEVIWYYGERQLPQIKNYNRKHDTILIYKKSKEYKFEMQFKPYLKNYIETFFNKKDKKGIYQSTDGGRGKPRYKRYLKDCKGIAMDTVWDDIKMIGNISKKKERMCYPTQKPLDLLNRLINTFTNKNDMVFDAFSGCGTTISSAQNLGRQWLGIDISKDAISVIKKRMIKEHGLKIQVIKTGTLSKADTYSLNPFDFEHNMVKRMGGVMGVWMAIVTITLLSKLRSLLM